MVALEPARNTNKYITKETSKKYGPLLNEFIGTFFLVLTVCLSVGTFLNDLNTAGSLAPLSIGSILTVFVFAGGHISGGHYNPAVTFAIYLAGRGNIESFNRVLQYWTIQIFGATIAGLAAFGMSLGSGVAPNPDRKILWGVFFAELFYTFALCWVVLNVATTKAQAGNSFFGFAIGLTVTAGAVSIGDISGCMLNPAVTVGLLLSDQITGGPYMGAWYVYLFAEFIAPCLAALLFYITSYEKEYFGAGSTVQVKDPTPEMKAPPAPPAPMDAPTEKDMVDNPMQHQRKL